MIGLVLSGGGARGAYQAGVVSAISEIAQSVRVQRPFQIFSGVSAGAINSTFLAAGSDNFHQTTKKLTDMWSTLSSEKVFYTDAGSLGKIGLKWMGDLSLGGLMGTSPGKALLDTAPLKDLLIDNLNFSQIQENIDKGFLRAVAVSAMEYQTSNTITFVQGEKDVPSWTRSRRQSELAQIKAEHVMASSAIPLLFPPIQIQNRYFGDGCVRNMAPCSPAIHLGADKLIVIGVRRLSEVAIAQSLKNSNSNVPPSAAKVFNVLLNSVLLDGVELDIERMNRINEFVSHVPKKSLDQLSFKPVDLVWIHPSQDIGAIAYQKASSLPRLVRYLLKGLGPLEDAAEIISYLSFDPEFCSILIDMGYEDGMASKEEIIRILQS